VVAQLTDSGDDPAHHSTRIVSFHSTDLRHFEATPGVLLAGTGLVDPALLRRPDRWELYYTDAGKSVRRALSEDGVRFQVDPSFSLEGYTVPAVAGTGLIVQAFVGDQPVFYRMPRQGDGYGAPQSLEVCGTGASYVEGRLYFSRDPALPPCAPPTVFPDRAPAW
jgi:hypothetical protein